MPSVTSFVFDLASKLKDQLPWYRESFQMREEEALVGAAGASRSDSEHNFIVKPSLHVSLCPWSGSIVIAFIESSRRAHSIGDKAGSSTVEWR